MNGKSLAFAIQVSISILLGTTLWVCAGEAKPRRVSALTFANVNAAVDPSRNAC
jgi:hypothetical protein